MHWPPIWQTAKSSLALRRGIVSQLGSLRMRFSDQEILEVRRGRELFDAQFDALARLVRNIALERGHTDPAGVLQRRLDERESGRCNRRGRRQDHQQLPTRVSVDFLAAPNWRADRRPCSCTESVVVEVWR
jgi:hypothetical protein